MLDFFGRLGAQAVNLGWTAPDMFSVHPTAGFIQVDHCGALVPGCAKTEWVDATRTRFGNLTYDRDKPGRPVGVPILAVRP